MSLIIIHYFYEFCNFQWSAVQTSKQKKTCILSERRLGRLWGVCIPTPPGIYAVWIDSGSEPQETAPDVST